MDPRKPALTFVVSLALAACATGGGPGGGSDAPMAYTVPAQTPVVYRQVDSARVVVEVQGQSMRASEVSDGTVSIEFSEGSPGVRATATFLELEASADNPMAGSQGFSEEDLEGPLVFDLSPTGEATLVSSPELSGNAPRLMSPATTAASLLPRLPGRTVTVGDVWTDTTTVVASEAVGDTESTTIAEYAVVADTLVEGRSMLRVEFVSEDSRHVEASMQGQDLEQDLAGEGTGWFLWDPATGLVHSAYSESALTGTMEVAAAPFPLTLTVTATSRTTRAGG